MLPKEERLRKRRDFDQVFKLKHSVATPYAIAYVMERNTNSCNDITKVAFIVSKKVHKKSAKRNKIKRRMRESYRTLKKTYPDLVKPFKFIIFIARPVIYNKDYFEIYKTLLNCLQKAQKYIGNKAC